MKVAIIGGGLAGVATAFFLQRSGKAEITLFDAVGIGGGASGICSGLIHPYPGLHVRRSYKAWEAFTIVKELLSTAENTSSKMIAQEYGILRHAFTQEQCLRLREYQKKWGDVEELNEELFFIHAGITLFSKQYLQCLWQTCERLGACFMQEKIKELTSLCTSFHCIIVAAGWGIKDLLDPVALGIKFLKGQIVKVKGIPLHKRSFVGNGYISFLPQNDYYEVGSTYERTFENDLADKELAYQLLKEKGLQISQEEVVDCKAGVRVMNGSNYLPLVKRISEKIYVFTGLGSRGLLYHGMYAKYLAQIILHGSSFSLNNKGNFAIY